MSYKPSAMAEEIVSVLDNAKQLAVVHHDRKLAKGVIIACNIYSKGLKFPVDEAFFTDLIAALTDKAPLPLAHIFETTKMAIVASDMQMQKPPKRTLR